MHVVAESNWTTYKQRNAARRAKTTQAPFWALMEDGGAEFISPLVKGLPFPLMPLEVVLAAAIEADSAVEVELGL
jgi:hypothetical protein